MSSGHDYQSTLTFLEDLKKSQPFSRENYEFYEGKIAHISSHYYNKLFREKGRGR